MKIMTLTLAFAGSQAVAQTVCAPHPIVASTMTENLGQDKIFTATTSDGLLVEIYGDAAGHWAIITTTPDILSCLLDGGEYHEVSPLLQGEAG